MTSRCSIGVIHLVLHLVGVAAREDRMIPDVGETFSTGWDDPNRIPQPECENMFKLELFQNAWS